MRNLFLFVMIAFISTMMPVPSLAQAVPAVTPTAMPIALGTGAALSKQAPYALFVRDGKRQTGFLDILQKEDEVYFDLGPEQFNRTYIVAPVLAAGIGGEAFAGRVYPSFLLRFKRVGKRVLWISPNTRYTASPEARASLDISVADSVLASSAIVAENQDNGHIVISASFFLTDIEDVGHDLGADADSAAALSLVQAPRAAFGLDAGKSYIERVKVFPKNVEILSDLAFNGQPRSIIAVPDARGVLLKMHYSLLEEPAAEGYMSRLADDRVGYFTTTRKRFGDDDARTPLVRYIHRWDLRKGPITYYLSNEIPPQYRPVVARALSAWGEAFAKIGYPHAIEVKEQPADPAWDPDDIRYTTVRWIDSDVPSFAAYAPTIVDPLTGQILRASIVIDGEAMRTIKRGYADMVSPLRGENTTAACQAYDCTYMADSASLAAAGTIALGFHVPQTKREQYAEEWLQSVVLHEAGHTFGLRHNFASSTIYSLSQLHDPGFTATHGLVGSVMEYTPVNLSPKGVPQGAYFQLRLGPYDEWAIRYGYAYIPNAKLPQDENNALRALASESTLPLYVYGTDEDAEGMGAIDPMIAMFDLSADPLAFDANQFTVAEQLVRDLDAVYPRDDRSYSEERQTFLTIMRTYTRAVGLTVKFIAGARTSRAHRGQPGAGVPLKPLTRDNQHRAFDLLADHVFSAHAFAYTPRLLDDLGQDYYQPWGSAAPSQPNFPITAYVASIQDEALAGLFDPRTLTRLEDQRLESPSLHDAVSLGDLFAWTQRAIWGDMNVSGTIRGNLRRRWTNVLIDFSLAPPSLLDHLGYPGALSSTARYELSLLLPRLRSSLASGKIDTATRVQFTDIAHRVENALNARSVQGT
jgi:Met-zincin/Domain of unknown function (DUF5117)